MKVLVACEESQAVTKEFRRLGHEAYSCDIIECSGGHPELLSFDGETHNIEGWCKITGLPRHIVDGRLARGWSVEKTLTTPILTKGGKVRES